jgi:hypothetical protein
MDVQKTVRDVRAKFGTLNQVSVAGSIGLARIG